MTTMKDLLTALALAWAASATGQRRGARPWPARPIHMIVPFPARQLARPDRAHPHEKLAPALGSRSSSRNRPGAGGNLGTGLVAKAAPTATPSASRSPGRSR